MVMDLTGDESQDWIDPGRRQQSDDRAQAAARYAEGDKVELDGQEGVVVEVWTSGERDGPDGETYDASEDSPVYVVATVDGAEAARASDLSASDWGSDVDDPDKSLADGVAEGADAALTASVEATLFALPADFDPHTDGTLTAGPTDWDYPDSWDESDTPNRVILLDAWSSMGGQFDCDGGCCKGTMMSSGMSDGASDRFCASMKDRVLMWEGWRQGG